MVSRESEYDALRDLFEGADVVGQIANDEAAFRDVFQAYRSWKVEDVQTILKRLGLADRFGPICQWVRSKECVFLCLELCGPVRPLDKAPDHRALAEAVVKFAADKAAVEQVVKAMDSRNPREFGLVVERLGLAPFCHFFCHWLCVIRWRMRCQWYYAVQKPPFPHLPSMETEIQEAAGALRMLLENRKAFDEAAAACDAGDAAKMKAVVEEARLIPYCQWICEWFCSRHCVLQCLTFCKPYVLEPIKDEIAEARAFALEVQKLAQKPDELQALLHAVVTGNADQWGTLIKRLELGRYCVQLYHWVCFVFCCRHCRFSCPNPVLYPQFTSIGAYDYGTDVDSALGGSGLTNAEKRAFYSTMRLNGILPQTFGGQPMEYRFETIATDASGNPLSGATWLPVKPNQIAPTMLGHWEHLGMFPHPVITKEYWVNASPGPNVMLATISADGWIQVPQEANFLIEGAFSSNGNMINLISSTLDAFTPADMTGVTAGNQAHPLVADHYFGIRMRVRQVGVPATETDGGTCEHVAIDNTLYKNITLHPYWAGGLQPPMVGVAMLGVDELSAAPCSQIDKSLTVRFTAAHPNLGDVTVTMAGPGGPYSFSLPAIPEAGDWYGIAAPSGFVVGNLKACAYTIWLTVNLLLTTGDSNQLPIYDYISFCKK